MTWELVKHSEKDINTDGGASDWGKLCARREAQCRPMLERDCDQSKTTNCVQTFCKLQQKPFQHPWAFGIQNWHTVTTLLYFHFSSRLTEMHPKNRIVFIFFMQLIFKALTEEYTYNLAHMVWTNRKTSHLKGVQVGRSPHQSMSFEL